jgi:hypothetical protein
VIGCNDCVVERRDRSPFAGNLGGDALVDLGGEVWVHENRRFRLAEHVDEPRRHDHAVGVDAACGWLIGEAADRGNASAAKTDVSRVPGRARPVDDAAVLDHDVEGRCCGRRPRTGRRGQDRGGGDEDGECD